MSTEQHVVLLTLYVVNKY